MNLQDLAEVVIISESVGVKKPHPEIFPEAVRALSSSGENALFVGDSPELDIVASARVGMQTAWLTLGSEWPPEYDVPDYHLSSLSDLRHILRLEVE